MNADENGDKEMRSKTLAVVFLADAAVGDTNGQGVGGISFAVSPSGDDVA